MRMTEMGESSNGLKKAKASQIKTQNSRTDKRRSSIRQGNYGELMKKLLKENNLQ